MEKLKSISKRSVPYLLILFLSIIGTILVFWKGLNRGDDFFYHLPNILDKYNSIISGNGLSGISSEVANGLGYGAGLFYSPLSHFTVAVTGALLKIFGISLISSYKLILVLSVFLSGVFMYNFAMKFTGGNKIASLLASACLIIYPYRLFNMFCRVAFAEAFAFTFMPLFFGGIYEVTHQDRENIKIMPFVKLVIGASLVFLSHNLTALFAYLVGFILFLVYIERLIKLFKAPKYSIYCVVSALLIVGISAIALFSQLELLGMDYYAVSNDESMRTDLTHVLNHVGKEWNYSGFLNISFLSGRGITSSFLFSGIVMYLFSCAIFVIVDTLLGKIRAIKYAHYVISSAILFVLISLVAPRLEGYLGAIIFIALYIAISLYDKGREEKPIYKNPLFWFSATVILFAFFAMRSEWLWENVPDAMRTIQFPWRLWSLVQMFLAVLIGLLASHLAKRKNALNIIAIFVGLLMLVNMPIIEKRNASEDKWFDEISDTYLDKSTVMGHQKEYCPQIYLESDYEPREGSLYHDVKRIIFKTNYNRDEKLSPVILKGDGEIVVNSLSAPKIDMSILLTEDSEIQLPLFYYPGYKIFIENADGERKITPYDVDGLIAFELEAGSYTVKTDYVGTPLRIFGKVLTISSSIITVSILGFAIYKETEIKKLFKKSKKEKACL